MKQLNKFGIGVMLGCALSTGATIIGNGVWAAELTTMIVVVGVSSVFAWKYE